MFLTREVNESITVATQDGELLQIVLLETRGKQARLGFVGSKEAFAILRQELHLQKGTEPNGTNAP